MRKRQRKKNAKKQPIYGIARLIELLPDTIRFVNETITGSPVVLTKDWNEQARSTPIEDMARVRKLQQEGYNKYLEEIHKRFTRDK